MAKWFLVNTCNEVLVIRRKEYGLTDIVSNEGRRPEFDTISVRPYSFRRITYVKHIIQSSNHEFIN